MRAKEFLNEVPLPPDWDPEKLNLRQKFKDRLKYALDRSKRIGGGSARVAMIIEYEGRPTVLKVAKNRKGLAQNEAEAGILEDSVLGKLSIVIPYIDHDKQNDPPVWIHTELAKRITTPTLKKLLHSPKSWIIIDRVNDITDFVTSPYAKRGQALKNYYFEEAKENNLNYTENDWNIFDDYAHQIATLVEGAGISTGDLIGANNWGVYNGRPVIVDLGLTDLVYDTEYRK